MTKYSFIQLGKKELQDYLVHLRYFMPKEDYLKLIKLESCMLICEQDENGQIVSFHLTNPDEMSNMINIKKNKPTEYKLKYNLNNYDNKSDLRNRRRKSENKIYTLLHNYMSGGEVSDNSSAKTEKYEEIISELEKQLKEANKINQERLAEIDEWKSKYNQAIEDTKKATNQLDVYKELLKEKQSTKVFTSREIAIIALALSRKADVVPKNKKNIADLFNKLTGVSANTLSINLCSSYKDEEVKAIADQIEEAMPEFAHYLRENKFAGVKK